MATDFRMQQAAPMEAIISAYQRKAAMEQEMKVQQEQVQASKQNRILQVFKAGSDVASNLTEHSRLKQQAEARTRLAEMLASGSDVVPGQNMKPASSTAIPGLTEAPIPVPRSSTPQYKAGLQQAVIGAGMGDSEVAKMAFGDSTNRALSGRDIQQKNLLLKDGTRFSGQLFETLPSEKYGTSVTWTDLAGNEIDPSMLAGAVEAPAPAVIFDQFGNPHVTERVGGLGARPISTSASRATTPTTEEEKEQGLGLSQLRAKAPKVADRVEKYLDNTDPANNQLLKTAVEGSSAASQVRAILEAEGDDISEVGLQSLGFYFARMSGSNSQLSDSEREVFEQPLAFLSRIKNKGYKLVKGDLSPKMRKDLQNLSKTIERKSRIQAKKELNLNKRRAESVAGKFWNKSLEESFPTLEELAVSLEDMQEGQGTNTFNIDTDAIEAELKRRGIQ